MYINVTNGKELFTRISSSPGRTDVTHTDTIEENRFHTLD